MTPESRITASITKYLKTLGPDCFYLKIHGGPMQRAGIPDLLVIHRGRWIFLEIKTQRGVVTPLQAAEMRRIEAAGGEAHVIRSLAEVVGIFETEK